MRKYKGRSYPDFFPTSRLRFGWVTSHLSLFPVTNWRVTFHLSHFWEECDALAHESMFFNLWRILSHPSRKKSHFGPAGTIYFYTGRNVTIRLGLKHVFLFPSQICHLSRKREAGRPFGLRPTLTQQRLRRQQVEHLLPQYMIYFANVKNDSFHLFCDEFRNSCILSYRQTYNT